MSLFETKTSPIETQAPPSIKDFEDGESLDRKLVEQLKQRMDVRDKLAGRMGRKQ